MTLKTIVQMQQIQGENQNLVHIAK